MLFGVDFLLINEEVMISQNFLGPASGTVDLVDHHKTGSHSFE